VGSDGPQVDERELRAAVDGALAGYSLLAAACGGGLIGGLLATVVALGVAKWVTHDTRLLAALMLTGVAVGALLTVRAFGREVAGLSGAERASLVVGFAVVAAVGTFLSPVPHHEIATGVAALAAATLGGAAFLRSA
jgi:hypothetical protein